MKRISLRHFTAHVREYDEPVEVVLQVKGSGEVALLGTWQPEAGFSRAPVEITEPPRSGGEDLVEEIRQLKRHLASRDVDKTGAPAMKPASNVRASTKPPPPAQVMVGTASFNSRPFTPAPHPGKGG